MNQTSKRHGFTLLELLVVLAIIAILLSLTAAAVFRLRGSRDDAVTNETLQKAQSTVDLQWSNALAVMRKEKLPDVVIMWAKHDMELARVIHLKLRLRQEFPDKVSELNATTLFPSAPPELNLAEMRRVYAPKGAYTQLQIAADFAKLNGDALNENAALLALVLSQSRGGGSFDADAGVGVNATSNFPGTSLKYFKDAWGRPINFSRYVSEQNLAEVLDEINNPPYVEKGEGVKPRTITYSRDPLDPESRLQRAASINPNIKPYLDQWLGQVNDGQNRRIVIFSRGRKAGFSDGDEIFGFRIKGFGKGS